MIGLALLAIYMIGFFASGILSLKIIWIQEHTKADRLMKTGIAIQNAFLSWLVFSELYGRWVYWKEMRGKK